MWRRKRYGSRSLDRTYAVGRCRALVEAATFYGCYAAVPSGWYNPDFSLRRLTDLRVVSVAGASDQARLPDCRSPLVPVHTCTCGGSRAQGERTG